MELVSSNIFSPSANESAPDLTGKFQSIILETAMIMEPAQNSRYLLRIWRIFAYKNDKGNIAQGELSKD